jgi:hypothetical protein
MLHKPSTLAEYLLAPQNIVIFQVSQQQLEYHFYSCFFCFSSIFTLLLSESTITDGPIDPFCPIHCLCELLIELDNCFVLLLVAIHQLLPCMCCLAYQSTFLNRFQQSSHIAILLHLSKLLMAFYLVLHWFITLAQYYSKYFHLLIIILCFLLDVDIIIFCSTSSHCVSSHWHQGFEL